jgi:uncharacterized protein (DUF885 family)
LERLSYIPGYLDDMTSLLNQGIALGWTKPKSIISIVPSQIDTLLTPIKTDSIFYKPFKTIPSEIPQETQTTLINNGLALIDSVYLAFQKYNSFIKNTLIPASRDTISVSKLPNGAAYYAYKARYYTTTDLTPSQIHAIGLSEVDRIKSEMETIKTELQFQGKV